MIENRSERDVDVLNKVLLFMSIHDKSDIKGGLFVEKCRKTFLERPGIYDTIKAIRNRFHFFRYFETAFGYSFCFEWINGSIFYAENETGFVIENNIMGGWMDEETFRILSVGSFGTKRYSSSGSSEKQRR